MPSVRHLGGTMTRKKHVQAVVGALERLRADMPASEGHKEIYHEGRHSYSLDDLISELKRQTPFGQAFAETMSEGAREEHIPIGDFLKRVAR